jgi:hypothetical protein
MGISLEQGFPKIPTILVNAQVLINGMVKNFAGEVVIVRFRVLENQFEKLQ